MLRNIHLLSLIIAIAAAMTVLFTFTGCGGGNTPAPTSILPTFYIQTAQNVVLGPWPYLPITYSDNGGGAATVAADTFVRVMVDSGEVHNLTVLSSLTGREDPYIQGTWVSWPAGNYRFQCSVTKPGVATDLVLYLTITPTQISVRHVDAYQGHTRVVPDTNDVAHVVEGLEVHFEVGGQAYNISKAPSATITWSFWGEKVESSFSFVPVTIPSTPGDPSLAQYYPLYHPARGRYIAQASMLYEGQAIQVLPLYFDVGL